MIPVWISDTARNALSLNSYTFNQVIEGDERDIIEIVRVQFQTPVQQAIEAREFSNGTEAYGAFARGKRIVMHGIVRASTRGKLYDRLEEFAAATHPALLSRLDADDFGVMPLTFQVPTADTSNFPSGLMSCQYGVRLEQPFEPASTAVQGLGVSFVISFFAPDPWRYLQTESTRSGSGTADNSVATAPSWPILTITMAGAGASNYTISNETAEKTLVLNLSGRSNEEEVVVDMLRRKITVDGVEMAGIYSTGAYFQMEAGGNVIDVSNDTNATSVLTWRPAFAF